VARQTKAARHAQEGQQPEMNRQRLVPAIDAATTDARSAIVTLVLAVAATGGLTA